MRRFLAILPTLAVGAILSRPSNGAETFPQPAVIHATSGLANLRQAASLESDVLTQIPDGERVTAFISPDEWWQIKRSNGQKGFVHRSNLRLGTTGEAATLSDSQPPPAKPERKQPAPPPRNAAPLIPTAQPTNEQASASRHAEPIADADRYWPLQPDQNTPLARYLSRLVKANCENFLAASYSETENENHLVRLLRALVKAEASPEAADVPQSLRKLVREAMNRQGYLLRLRNPKLTPDDVIRFLTKLGAENGTESEAVTRELQRLRADIPQNRINGIGFNPLARGFSARSAWTNYNGGKNRAAPHQSWKNTLTSLADQGVKIPTTFVDQPWYSDPSWQFMKNAEAGDSYEGWSFGLRSKLVPNLNAAGNKYAGNLLEGPILFHIKTEGDSIQGFDFDSKVGLANRATLKATKGHFGTALCRVPTLGYNYAGWAARGFQSSLSAVMKTADGGNRFRLIVMHFNLPGSPLPEDSIAEGQAYLYLEGIHPDDPTKAENLRHIEVSGANQPVLFKPQ